MLTFALILTGESLAEVTLERWLLVCWLVRIHLHMHTEFAGHHTRLKNGTFTD